MLRQSVMPLPEIIVYFYNIRACGDETERSFDRTMFKGWDSDLF